MTNELVKVSGFDNSKLGKNTISYKFMVNADGKYVDADGNELPAGATPIISDDTEGFKEITVDSNLSLDEKLDIILEKISLISQTVDRGREILNKYELMKNKGSTELSSIEQELCMKLI